jgi:hypothetical protein
MKWQASLLITFGIFVFFIGGWLGYITFLTKERNRACRINTLENQGDKSSTRSMKLQHVINDYSTQKGGIGLQATVIFPDGQTWNGEAGYADIAHQCSLTLDHHLYLGSITIQVNHNRLTNLAENTVLLAQNMLSNQR